MSQAFQAQTATPGGVPLFSSLLGDTAVLANALPLSPDTDGEMVVAYLDNVRVDTFSIVTRHGADHFRLTSRVGGGRHDLTIKWFDGARLVKTLTRVLG